MKTFTTKQAARIGKCHISHIARLIKRGKIQADRSGGLRGRFNITTPKDEIRNIVMKESPRAGFKKYPVTSNGNEPHSVNKSRVSNSLKSFLEWAQLTDARRDLLMKVNDKFTEDDLKIILSL